MEVFSYHFSYHGAHGKLLQREIDPASIDGEKYVDGGVWNITPIGDFLRLTGRQIDHIYVINCQMDDEPEREPVGVRGILGVAKESISMLMERNVQADERFFQTVNKIVEASGEEAIGKYRRVASTIIQPSRPLGSGMDASETRLQELFWMGYDDAARAID